MSEHRHSWRPLPHWMGRYRCTECAAIGYRQGSARPELHRQRGASAIVPYRCQYRSRGKRCKMPAQVATREGLRACWKHWKQWQRKGRRTGSPTA